MFSESSRPLVPTCISRSGNGLWRFDKKDGLVVALQAWTDGWVVAMQMYFVV